MGTDFLSRQALAVTKLKLFKNQLWHTIFVTFWRNNRDKISSTWSLNSYMQVLLTLHSVLCSLSIGAF